MRFKHALIVLVAGFSGFAVAEDACFQDPRTVNATGETMPLSTGEGWTRVVLPEEGIVAFDPTVRVGIEVDRVGESLPNRFVVRTTDPEYTGLLFVIGTSGKDYSFRVQASECQDSRVTVSGSLPSAEGSRSAQEYEARDQKTLVGYMYQYKRSNGDMPVPTTFRSERVAGTSEERLIMEAGSLQFFIDEIWHGATSTGLIVEVLNRGRKALHLNLAGFDFNSPSIRNSIGDINRIAMMPISANLAPAPEYLEDVYDQNTNRGFLFISLRN